MRVVRAAKLLARRRAVGGCRPFSNLRAVRSEVTGGCRNSRIWDCGNVSAVCTGATTSYPIYDRISSTAFAARDLKHGEALDSHFEEKHRSTCGGKADGRDTAADLPGGALRALARRVASPR